MDRQLSNTLVALVLASVVSSCGVDAASPDAGRAPVAPCAERALIDCERDDRCSLLSGMPIDRNAQCALAPSSPVECVVRRHEGCGGAVACAEDATGALWSFGVGCNLDQSRKFKLLQTGDCYGPPCSVTATDAAIPTRDAGVDAAAVYEEDGGVLHTYVPATGHCVTDLACKTAAACMEDPSDLEQKCADGWTIVDASYGTGFKRNQSKCDVRFDEYYDEVGKLVARTRQGSYCGGRSTVLVEGDADLVWSVRHTPWAKGGQNPCVQFRDGGGFGWDDAGIVCP